MLKPNKTDDELVENLYVKYARIMPPKAIIISQKNNFFMLLNLTFSSFNKTGYMSFKYKS